MILTKSDIINGKNNIQEIEIPQLNGSLKLRPLTDGEYQKITNLMKNGGLGKIKTTIKTTDTTNETQENISNLLDLEIDPLLAEKQRYKADITAIHYSLDHKENKEIWTLQEIKQFPAGTIDTIAQKVYQISGIADPNTTRQEIKSFRPKK
jgi:hypothetical protein